MNTKMLSKLKKGDYFRMIKGKEVYTYGGKDRTYGYYAQRRSDILGDCKYWKKDKEVEIEFDY